jgi:transcriptional regulator with GAF, ATPase, and Fis domain
VLITGESGTGKELVADADPPQQPAARRPVRQGQPRRHPPSLFESEMFRHVRGAFTDARADRKGRFELAAGGTIFLDEIGDVDPSAQAKLLRVLQDRTYESSDPPSRDGERSRRLGDQPCPRGGRRPREFREDLLYRLNLIGVHVPPLRERAGDVARLAAGFLEEPRRAYGVATERRLAESAVRWLEAQPWPGNVRQLRHLIERASS